jgi:hypothetical protein
VLVSVVLEQRKLTVGSVGFVAESPTSKRDSADSKNLLQMGIVACENDLVPSLLAT